MRLLFLLLFLSSCSVFNFGTSKSKPVPHAPKEFSPELKASVQQSADIADQIADIAQSTGVQKQSTESRVLKDQTQNLKMVLGVPTERIMWDDPRVENLNKEISRLETEQRKEREAWENKINAMATNSSIEKANLKWWLWALGVCLAILCFLCPTIGVPLVFWLFKRGGRLASETANHFKDQMGQVVGAIEEYKKEAATDEVEKLKIKLSTRMNSDTKALVSEIKNKI